MKLYNTNTVEHILTKFNELENELKNQLTLSKLLLEIRPRVLELKKLGCSENDIFEALKSVSVELKLSDVKNLYFKTRKPKNVLAASSEGVVSDNMNTDKSALTKV